MCLQQIITKTFHQLRLIQLINKNKSWDPPLQGKDGRRSSALKNSSTNMVSGTWSYRLKLKVNRTEGVENAMFGPRT